MNTFIKLSCTVALAAATVAAQAAIVRIDKSAFTAQAGKITFSEKTLGTVNPFYNPADYGGAATAPTVSFDGYFDGQSLGAGCGGAASGCVVGSPTGTLQLAAAAPDTKIVGDGSNPTSPVLSGTPTFNGPIAILFGSDVAGVGLDGGFFNAIGGTAITAYARDGSFIGQVANTALGIEFLGLVTDDGQARIAGLLFSLVGSEPAGFAIDNLFFGESGQVVVPGIPEPSTYAMMLLGLGAVGFFARRRKA